MVAIDDSAEREQIWLAFSDLFLDTDVTTSYDYIVNRCASSKYSIAELETILKNEVAPACSFNLSLVAGEWAGFDEDWLRKRIARVLESRRTVIGKILALILNGAASCNDGYVNTHWRILAKRIEDARRTGRLTTASGEELRSNMGKSQR